MIILENDFLFVKLKDELDENYHIKFILEF